MMTLGFNPVNALYTQTSTSSLYAEFSKSWLHLLLAVYTYILKQGIK